MSVDLRRVRALNERPAGSGPVLYWMSRDQRVQDNWALIYAQQTALERKVPLIVGFFLSIIPTRAQLRHYDFMMQGLAEVENELETLGIPFFVIEGTLDKALPDFVEKQKIEEVVVDFSPLKYARARRGAVASALPVLLTEVDAHNVIPCWLASNKEEFAAYTFRPKVHRALTEYLTPFPKVTKHPHRFAGKVTKINWHKLLTDLPLNDAVAQVSIASGAKAAKVRLREFTQSRLDDYHVERNDPTKNGVSGLSPYLHFGQLSAQKVALEVSKAYENNKEAREAFLEELIVRRELADNYCFYNENYDKLEGAHAWAQKSLLEHKNDPREHLYTKKQLESASTHDDLWNAMQMQMVKEGKMHGWCRMYWAKKILEWTPDVQTAIDIAIYLNDKYELDGNDPNGYVGVMWSICGVHDRAWGDRSIFGKVRYMNYSGAKRKFDIKTYIERYGGKERTLFN